MQEREEKMFLRSGQFNLMIETDPIGTSKVPHFLYKPHWEKMHKNIFTNPIGTHRFF